MADAVMEESNVDIFADENRTNQKVNLCDFLVNCVKLETKVDSLEGTCTCICISDCACNPSCYTQ